MGGGVTQPVRPGPDGLSQTLASDRQQLCWAAMWKDIGRDRGGRPGGADRGDLNQARHGRRRHVGTPPKPLALAAAEERPVRGPQRGGVASAVTRAGRAGRFPTPRPASAPVLPAARGSGGRRATPTSEPGSRAPGSAGSDAANTSPRIRTPELYSNTSTE